MSILSVLCDFKPKSFLHYRFNQIAIVPLSDKYLERLIVFKDIKLSVHPVCEVDHKQKLPKLVDFVID
jgi:hypothetical protein